MSGLFLSYSRADRVLADQIIRGLRSLGVAVWWDEDMRGVDWQQELEQRINELAGVMVIWTAHSVNSNPVRDEARLGLETDKLVNVLEGITKPPFPYDRINGLPLDGWTGREPHRGWTRLVETVEEMVVQNGGAQPGDITVALALREQEIRRKTEAIGIAQEDCQLAQRRESEAVEAAKSTVTALTHLEEQLQRVAEMRVTPMILKAAQQEFDAARVAREEAEAARKTARQAADDATRAVSKAKADLEAMFSAPVAAPVLPDRGGPPPRARAMPRTPQPAAEAPVEQIAVPATKPAPAPPKPRKAKAAAKVSATTVQPVAQPAPAPPPRPPPAPVVEPVAVTPPLAPPQPAVAAFIPTASAGPAPPAKTQSLFANPNLRWVAIASVIGILAVIAVVVLTSHKSVTPGSALAAVDTVGLGPTTPLQGANPLKPAANPALALVGAWASQGFTCDDPNTFAVSGDVLLVTSSGRTFRETIKPSSTAGVIDVQADDGAYRYTIRHNHTLIMLGPNGAAMTMTKCAG